MAELSFGPFSVDLAAARLVREGVDLRLRPRAFHALKTLVLNRGRYVDYDGMIAEAWDGVLVSRHTVDVTVGEVKKVLGEYGSWISHRTKVGYSLTVPMSDELVRRGWHFWNQLTREGFERALGCFEQAASGNGVDFRPFEGISWSYLMLATYGMRPPRAMYARFLEAHGRVETLCGLTPELRSTRAHGLHMFERKLAEAESEFLRALQEKPTLASAYIGLSLVYQTMGRLDDALAVLRQAHRVDPLLPVLPATEAFVRFCRRDFDSAVACAEKSLELHPSVQLGRTFYAKALEYAGRLDEALVQYGLSRVLSPDCLNVRVLEAACLAKQKRRREAGAILEELEDIRASQYVDAYFVAVLLDLLGERRKAFRELERAVEENSAALYVLDVDPTMDPFRGDARFARLREKVFAAQEAH